MFTYRLFRQPGYGTLKQISKTSSKDFVRYTWKVGTPKKSSVKAILKFENDDFVLTCSGEGAIKDFDPQRPVAYWYSLCDITMGWLTPIDKVFINEGITCFARMEPTQEYHLPSTLKTINNNAFYVNKDCKFYYNSTIEDWKKVELAEGWNYTSAIPDIICTDGVTAMQDKK